MFDIDLHKNILKEGSLHISDSPSKHNLGIDKQKPSLKIIITNKYTKHTT